jgi:PhnB protein
MDFRVGGTWLYYMHGPDGSRHYSRADYKSITPNKSYETLDAFCDDKGNINHEFGQGKWWVQFNETEAGTRVNVEITLESVEVLEKFIAMGFKEGFTMAHSNLDELLETQKV